MGREDWKDAVGAGGLEGRSGGAGRTQWGRAGWWDAVGGLEGRSGRGRARIDTPLGAG